jgi:hypothetical protein
LDCLGFQGSVASLKDCPAVAKATLHLGYPNPDTINLKGIQIEHTKHPSSRLIVSTPIYSIVTCLLIEFVWAMFEEGPKDFVLHAVLRAAFRFLQELAGKSKSLKTIVCESASLIQKTSPPILPKSPSHSIQRRLGTAIQSSC